jgi:hypothetical protein
VKITVITDLAGNVLGTVRQRAEEGQPAAGLIAGAGQKAYEIELSPELEEIESPDALHEALKRHLAE